MRLLRIMLPLLALLIGSVAATADYNPTNPPEPGVNFLLTTRSVPAGAANSITASATYAFGTSVSLRASANTGFRFVRWEDEDGNEVSAANNFTYTMPARDVTLTARFVYDPSSPSEPSTPEFKSYSTIDFKVYPSGAGYFSDNYAGNYEIGTTQRFSVRSNTNYRFVNWTCDGIEIGTSSTLEYTIPSEDKTLVANFEYNPGSPEEPGEPHFYRTLTLQSNPTGGASSLYGGGSYLDGSSHNVYCYANDYYHFVNWTDEQGEVVSESRDFYYTMPNRDVTLTANFTHNYNPASPDEPGVPDPDGSVAENMVAWPRMGMYDDTHVQILCETPGAEIHYTLDGSTPTASSPVYTEPVFVPSNLLVKAIAYKEGMEDSPVVSYQVSVYHAGTPVFTFENRMIKITSDTPDAIIRYTLDFTDPNEESDVYTSPLEPVENCRIKAYASKEGLTDSPVSIYVFRRGEHTLPAPTFSVNDDDKLVITSAVEGAEIHYTIDGSEPDASSPVYTAPVTIAGNWVVKAYSTHINYYDSPVADYVITGYKVETPTYSFENPLLTLSTATEGAEIRYTLNGTEPGEDATLYSGPIRLTADCTVTARGFKTDNEPSDPVSFTYIYADYQLPVPTASFADRYLTLTCSDSEAEIRYTVDGSDPAHDSTLYEGPIALTEDCTVWFIAVREHYNDSEAGSYEFKLSDHQVAKPALTYDSENLLVTITCETEEASIRYTTDGSVPTATSGIEYTAPIPVVGNWTYTAVAFRSDLFDSEAGTLTVDDQKVPTPTASFGNRHLTLTCEDGAAEIRYTVDGSTPTHSSTLYEGPVALTEDCTVRFIGVRDHFLDSEVGSYDFKVSDHRVATPEAQVGHDSPWTYIVEMTCATENAEIRYTIDDNEPTATTGQVYSEPIMLAGNHYILMRAFRSDLYDSEVGVLVIDDQQVPKPGAYFENRHLTLFCPDFPAEIYYSIDGGSYILYTGPIALTEDCTVRYIGRLDEYNFIPSEEGYFEFRVANYQVAQPQAVYDPESLLITVECATEGAEIRYTIDGDAPTATSGDVYNDPIPVIGNHIYSVRAFRSDLFDSEITVLTVDDQKVPTPTASFGNRHLTLTCEDGEAEIRYTTDGSTPTHSSTLYEEPVALTEDCTVMFIGIREYFHDSEPGSYEFRVADHQVATPVPVYDPENLLITVDCATEGAEIRYTIDGDAPTATTGEVYSDHIDVVGNHTYTIRAFRSDLFDSEIATEVVDDQRVPKPTCRYGGHHLTLECGDGLAEIRYTVDDSQPTETSTLYEAPIALSNDCTVRFIAIRQYFHNSEEEHYDFILSDHQETVPSIHNDFPNRLLTVEHPKSLSVKVRIGDIDTVEPTPWTVEVTPEMESISVTAIAEDEDLYDSEEYTEAIVFHMPPVLSYDGHAVYGTVAEGDPFAGEATLQCHFNGDICEGGTQDAPVEISEFGTVSAHVVSGSAFRSEPSSMEIDCFNTGSLAGVRNGHRLAEVFGSWDNGTTVYRSLDVCGELEREDLEFIATLPLLTALNLEPSLMTSEPCDGVFADTRIETLSANALPQGILKGMPRLTTVVWTPADRKMPDGRLADTANPNILLWISDTENAPSDAFNVVTYGSDETPTATNPSGVTGTAGSISLYDKYPYNAFMPVDAARVEFHKEFTQPTEIEVCQGWETMVIPFTATTIMHEIRGEITPYLTWSKIDTDPKPFWLYRASGSGWEEAGEIEAGVPYIISMPNHPDYIYAFNLGGNVTFSAENVWLGTEESLPHPQDWQDGMVFEPTYMPVEGDMLSLNVNGEGGLRTGSTFVPEAETLPFGCYISNAGTRMAVPVFDQWNGIIATTVAADDLTVDTPSPGTIRISSGSDRKVALYTPTGIVVATPALRAGEPVYIDNLAKGIYIVGGVKVMVK